MAEELTLTQPSLTGETLYARLWRGATVRDVAGAAWVAWADADVADYTVPLTELDAASGRFVGDAPAGVTAPYEYDVIWQAAGAPAVDDLVVGGGNSASETLTLILAAAGGGVGAVEFIYTVTDFTSAEPIAGVNVWVTSQDTDPASGVVASGVTDDNGEVTFFLDPGTWYFWRARRGYNFTNPDTEVVT